MFSIMGCIDGGRVYRFVMGSDVSAWCEEKTRAAVYRAQCNCTRQSATIKYATQMHNCPAPYMYVKQPHTPTQPHQALCLALVDRQCAAAHPVAMRMAQLPTVNPATQTRLAAFAVAHCPDQALLDALRLAGNTVEPTVVETTTSVMSSRVLLDSIKGWLTRCVDADPAPGLPSCGLGALALGAAYALPSAALEEVCGADAGPRLLFVASVAASLMALEDAPLAPSTPPPTLWAASSQRDNAAANVAGRLCARLAGEREAQAASLRVGAAASAVERARRAGAAAAAGDADALAVLLGQDVSDHHQGGWSDVHWAFLEGLLPALPAGVVPQSAKDGVNAAVGTLTKLDPGRLHRQLLQQVMPRLDGTDAAHVLLLLRALKHCAQPGGAPGVYDALVEFVKRVRSVGALNFKVLLQPVLLPGGDEVRLLGVEGGVGKEGRCWLGGFVVDRCTYVYNNEKGGVVGMQCMCRGVVVGKQRLRACV